MHTILIADHHPVTQTGISSLLKAEGNYDVIATVRNGDDIFKFLTKFMIDLLILEIDIPNFQSITAIKKLKQEFPNTKTLVFSCYPEEVYALSAIKCGASGYITKTASLERIASAIKQVCRGGIYINESLSNFLAKNPKSSGHCLISKYKKLSARETEVLNLLSKGKRNKEISDLLGVNEKTISTYKMRLLKKLEAKSIAELVKQSQLLLGATV